jgi:8-amino-7-oxononanoate synthase
MSSLDASLKPALDSRRIRSILRDVPDSAILTHRPRQSDFSSNDYLSLSTSSKLKQEFINKINNFPRVLGSGGSRLLDGGTLEHALLEERLAAFFGSPAALLYTSGYDANVGFFGSVPLEGDMVIYDSLIHASVHDGMRTSRAARVPGSLQPFEHNSVVSLRAVLQLAVDNRPALRRGIGNVLIAVESLYSMDGDIAPMGEICNLLDELLPCKNGHLVVDEAHATGIYGRNGRGLVSFFGLEDKVTARLHTFGKALASSGGGLSAKRAPVLTQSLIDPFQLFS